MAYQKQTFINEETVLTAEMLNHIEDGIVQNERNIDNKVSKTELDEAVDTALTEAKESGEFDGKSAYEYAQEGGYEGSEEEFADILATEPFKISVKNYGAKGDGSTDDTEAFQTALSENRLVYVPEGTYIISDTLTIEENSELELSQATHLKFTQIDKHCIAMKRIASLKGNHATITVPYTFTANVIHASTDVDVNDNLATPPFTRWTPQWKNSRYVTDINICKPDSRGFHYSVDGDCYGTAIYLGCYRDIGKYMWGVNMSGVRIAGGFTYGIHIYNETGVNSEGKEDNAWNHDMRIEAVMDACETGVLVETCNNAHLAVTIQPRRALKSDGETYVPYAKHGIKLVNSKNIDLSSSCVWDWNGENTLWTTDNEYQHIVMLGQCRGLILGDFLYYENSTDIRNLIYTDTPSNLEKMTILQEPITRWFKPKNNEPYFTDGYNEKRLLLQEEFNECFITDNVPAFKDVLSTAIDIDGTIYNGVGYKEGYLVPTNPPTIRDSYAYILTGLIPCKQGSKIHTANFNWNITDNYCRLFFYDENREPIPNGSYIVFGNASDIVANNSELTKDYAENDNNGFAFTIGSAETIKSVAYIRINIRYEGLGTNPLIAIDEEIKYTQAGFLADEIKVKAENVIDLPSGGNNVQSDLSQNDETQPDYVKGRTHWSEQKEVTLIDNQTYTAGELQAEDNIYPFTFKEGQVVKVTWNGTLYEREAIFKDGFLFVGNPSSIIDEDDNGDPFTILDYTSLGLSGCSFSVMDGSENITLTVETTEEIVHEIPIKYISNALPYYVLCIKDGNVYTTTETPENLKAAITSGRQVIVKVLVDGESFQLFALSGYSIDLTLISFTSFLGITLIFQEIDNGYDIST